MAEYQNEIIGGFMFTENVNLNGYGITSFVWPFVLQKEKTNELSLFDCVSKAGWVELQAQKQDIWNEDHAQLMRDCFMADQYFSDYAGMLFHNEECFREYRYPQRDDQKFVYFIKINDKEQYELEIASIELHVYMEEIGILFINTVNAKYPEIDQIKRINDYGRRIALAFLPQNVNGFILCAEQLGVKSTYGASITDFRKRIGDYFNGKITKEQLREPAEFLIDILNYNLGHNCENKIKPMVSCEDRMYLQSLIRNDELSQMIQSGAWKQHGAQEELLYSILFVDPSDATCRDDEMRQTLLHKSLYPRWADYGTIHGMTNYSMMALTGRTEWINESVVRPFLVEYGYMLSVVAAQKAGVEKFMKEAVESAFDDGEDEGIKGKRRKRWKRLKNILMLPEFSTQDQGTEIYELLKQQMKIEEWTVQLSDIIEE